MARIPIPTAEQDAKGYFLKHPERKRTGEVTPSGALPKTPPKNFTAEEKKLWKWFVKTCPPGVATAWDLPFVKALVRLLAKEELRTITAQERAQMISLGAKFGMTASDRAKIAIEAPTENKLQSFLNRKKPAAQPPVVQ